ncbi:hypothetical protein [Streptomyces sp. NPDC014622]|uniref:hypothetical protein n=1 Tax=Streptomyces sp. NPDC014622 TaxID=3364874 RepID=UPI0036FEF086
MVRCPRRGHRRPDGGARAEGLRDGVVAAFNAYARVRGLLTATDPDPGADLIDEGLTVVVSVKPDHPECRGCHTRRAGRRRGASPAPGTPSGNTSAGGWKGTRSRPRPSSAGSAGIRQPTLACD